jgi:hypothetical protein
MEEGPMNQSRDYTAEEFKAIARDLSSEDEFQDQVIAFAQLHGWKVAHFRKVRVQRKDGSVYWETPVQADGKGFPDLMLTRERVIYAELKSKTGRFEPEQKEWAAALVIAKQEVYGWRPADWPEIERVLA